MQESRNIAPTKELTFDDDDTFTLGGERPAGEDSPPSASQLDEVAKLLAGDDDAGEAEKPTDDADAKPEDDSEDAGAEKPDNDGPPKTLDDLAEKLGVKAADLYDIEVGLPGDGDKTITLGKLKDGFIAADALEVERLTFEETRTEKEAALMRGTQELTEIVAMLPRSALTDDLLQAVANRRAEITRREEKLTLDAIPEWSDEDVETRERQEIGEFMGKYGFPKNYVSQLVDHRTIRLVRDAMLREQRIRKALEQVTTVRKPGHPSKPPPSKPKRQSKRRTRRVTDEVAQVKELLNL